MQWIHFAKMTDHCTTLTMRGKVGPGWEDFPKRDGHVDERATIDLRSAVFKMGPKELWLTAHVHETTRCSSRVFATSPVYKTDLDRDTLKLVHMGGFQIVRD
jgi:hypothetical protein